MSMSMSMSTAKEEEEEEVIKKKAHGDSSITRGSPFGAVQAEVIELVKTTKDVSVLDSILQQLKHHRNEDEYLPPSKRICRPPPSHDDDDVDRPTSPLQHGEILCSIVGWLGPKDLLSCVQVSKQWKNDIDIPEEEDSVQDAKRQQQLNSKPQQQQLQQKMLWKEVATNHAPSVVKAIENRCLQQKKKQSSSSSSVSSSPPSSSDLTMMKKLNLKSIVKGLVYEESLYKTRNDETTESTTELEDFTVFVEAFDLETGNILGSWQTDLFSDFDDSFNLVSSEGSEEPLLPHFFEELGSYDDHGIVNLNDDPLADTTWAIHERISFTARIFRCDTGESFCFGFDPSIHDDNVMAKLTNLGNEGDTFSSVDLNSSAYAQPDTDTKAGRRATAFLANKQRFDQQPYEYIGMNIFCSIDTVVPADYLQQQQGRNRSSDDDSWRAIRHKFKELRFEFMEVRHDQKWWNDIVNPDDLLLCLDGLAWKK